jgi:TfoX/Sxy family transcriptional regulator of competence genes
MAYDEALADRVRDVIGIRSGVKERKMFSALAWMIDGNMACGVIDDELLVRLDREEVERVVAEPHARRFEPAPGRTMGGFVVVAAPGLEEDAELARWVDCGADHAATLPPK